MGLADDRKPVNLMTVHVSKSVTVHEVSNSKGIGIQGLSSNALHKLLFPLPPLSEQYRIVEAIETVFAQLDSILTSVS